MVRMERFELSLNRVWAELLCRWDTSALNCGAGDEIRTRNAFAPAWKAGSIPLGDARINGGAALNCATLRGKLGGESGNRILLLSSLQKRWPLHAAPFPVNWSLYENH